MKNMKSLLTALSFASVLVASAAHAQVGGYIVAQQPQAYVPLSGYTDLTPNFSSLDEGFTIVPLNFTFTYFGQAYTHVGVSTNGVVFLLTAAQAAMGTTATPCSNGTSSNCYSNTNIPTSGAALSNTVMKQFIAPWWDDLEAQSSTNSIRYTMTTNEMDIEFANYDYFSTGNGTGPFDFMVKLKDTNSNAGANDQVQVWYGTHSGSGGTASAGLQDQNSLGLPFFACTNATSHCTQANWPTNTLLTIDTPVGPELGVTAMSTSALSVTSGGNVSFNFSATVQNYGQSAANNFFYKVLLSTDQTADSNDIVAFDSSSGSSTSIAAGTTSTITGSGSATAVPTGNYYVLFVADSTNVVTETIESNNTGSTTATFTAGVDLVATSVSGAPANTGPGNPINLTVNVSNTGSQNAATVPYAIVLSTDKVFNSSDFVAYTGTLSLNANQTIAAQPVSFNLPGNTPGGSQYFGIVLDNGNTIAEASETNNVAFAASPSTVTQADLIIDAIDLLDSASAAPSRSSYMGDTRTVKVVAHNGGGANAVNWKIGVILSTDSNLSLQPVGSDYVFVDCGPYTLNIGQAATFTCDVTMPSTTKLVGGQPLPTGDYYIFGMLDSEGSITEINKNNNVRNVGPIRLYAPSPDLATVKVQVPAATAVGEIVPVYRVFRNVGIQDSPTVQYRYYASVNELITEEDVPLEILKGDGSTETTRDIQLLKNASNADTDFVRLPATMAPGTYYIGAVIDPDNTIAELNEVNNSAPSTATIQVAAPAMRITTAVLPDATVDRPYLFKLQLTGAPGTATWTAVGAPSGVTVSPDGTLTGTPNTSGVFAFDVTAASSGRSATTRLVLRVLPNSPELAILTQNLPPIVNNNTVPYSASLAAAGGTRPYTWKVAAGSPALPNGIVLKQDGTLSGSPSGVPVGETKVTFAVTDGVGNRAQSTVRVRVVAPGSVIIDTLVIPDAMVNSDYITDLTAKAAAGGTLSRPLNWTLAAGSLPNGITLTTQQGDRGILQGKALTPGTYLFTLQVEDAVGRTDSADYVLRVFATHFPITGEAPTNLHPGDDVSFTLTSGSGFPVTYSIYSGALPAGLSMDEHGAITGTVDSDPEKSVGVYNLVVAGKDQNGGDGLGAVTIEVTPRPAQQGCSIADGKPSVGAFALLGLALLGLLRRSRKGAFAAVAAVGVIAFAQNASAQNYTYTVAGPISPGTYTPIVGGTVINASTFSGAIVSLPFPVKYYGQTYTSVGVAIQGYLDFTNSDLTEYANRPIPHSQTAYPSLGIAAWWDDLEDTTGTVVSSKIFGAAPNREFVIDWNGVVAYPTVTKFNFQVRLFEGSSKIRVSYGAGTPGAASASVGIMGGLGVGVAGLSCTTTTSGNCTTSSFPLSKDLEYSLPADLAAGQLGGDDTGYAGVSYRSTAVLQNVGGTTAYQQTVRFYLSTNTVIEPGTDPVIGESAPVDVTAGSSKTVVAAAPIPAGTAPGTYWLLAKADPNGTLAEPDENNNVAQPVQLVVGAPTPDLQPVAISTTATTAVPGQTITANAQVSNPGNAAMSSPVQYTFFLSDNSVASYSDFAFSPAGTLSSLAAGATSQVTQQLTLPNDLPAGKYWLGICVDYDPSANPTSTLQEISEVNNCATTSTAFVVSSGALTVLTTSLPGATRYSPYAVHLDASGGNGTYTWSLSSGALPQGMTLTSAGMLQGSPSQAGAFGFQAQVVSGQETKTQDLTLNVTDANIPLAVAEQDLPTAEFGKAYAGHLIAIGGKPPYTWSLKADESVLPPGLALAADGTVEGRATPSPEQMAMNPQPFVLSVVVTDSANVQAAREVKISVAKPTQLQVATTALQTGYITLPGQEAKHYTQRLDAIGGAGGYVWRVERFQQLAQGPTEVPGPVLTELPASLGISIVSDAQGTVSLDGVPAQAGLYAVTLRVRDRNGVEDATTLPLLVSYDEALAVTTTALPDAFIGRPYNVRVLATQSASNVSFSAACVEEASADLNNFSCAQTTEKQSVPPGLFLGADGTITGTPVAPSTWDGKTPQTFSFLIKAQDVQGRYDVRGLSIRVQPNYEDAKSGCSGTAMGPEVFTLLALAGLSFRRRTSKK